VLRSGAVVKYLFLEMILISMRKLLAFVLLVSMVSSGLAIPSQWPADNDDPYLEALRIGYIAGSMDAMASTAKVMYGYGVMDFPTYSSMIIDSNRFIRDYNDYINLKWGNDTKLINSIRLNEYSI